MHIYLLMCVQVWRPDLNVRCLLLFSTLVFETGLSAHLQVTEWLEWLAGKLHRFACLPNPPTLSTKVTEVSHYSQLYMFDEDP